MIVEDEYEVVPARGRSFVTGALISAVVSAGLALLYAPAEGRTTRKRVARRLGKLEKEARRSRPAKEAQRQVRLLQRRLEERQRAEQRRRRRAMLIAAAVGAGIGLLLAPESGRMTRRRLGEGARQASRRAGEAASKLRGGGQSASS